MFEFFWTTDKHRLIVHDMAEDSYLPLDPGMTRLIKMVEEYIRRDYPGTWEKLIEEYPKPMTDLDPWPVRFNRINRFLKCNFSVQDNQPDIDDDGNFDFENVPCPLRGECDRGYCMPQPKSELSDRELEIIHLVPEGLTNEEMGTRLFISARTVQNHLYRIYRKLGFNGKAHPEKLLINYAYRKKLIK